VSDIGRVMPERKIPLALNSHRMLDELTELYVMPGWHLMVQQDRPELPPKRRTALAEVLTEFMDGDLDYDTALSQLEEITEMDR
jgi:hypothetical protein